MEAQAWADEWVAQHVPSQVVSDLTACEREHFAIFNAEYGRYVAQFEVEFSALADLLNEINFIERSAWPQHRSIQYVLISYNVKTFYSAFDRLARGYYEDATSLTRGLYETFIRVLFISCYPADAYSALAKPPKGSRQFNLTNFLRQDLGLEWETKYRVMSAFAHSNTFRALVALERASRREGEPEQFGLTHGFDPSFAEMAIPFLQFVLLTHLRFTVNRLVDRAKVKNPGVLSAATDAAAALSYGLRSHPKPYWQRVRTDLDLIFDMLVIADEGGDWREFLATHRVQPASAVVEQSSSGSD